MQRWTLVISGKVQGVFYRKSTAEQAQSLGLTGTVRNLTNGDVEVIAEGAESVLQQLYEWCQQGPERAHVDRIDVRKCEGSGEFDEFSVVS